ncbi:MAG: 2-C-methyl-D-erythritol 4-phosphate cytidylyltransferase [Bacteroidales bacterium]|nr:2-C-methyl-D-erythritol 4-phosphate cytidylyltransferase [Bacteroidales bacterium]
MKRKTIIVAGGQGVRMHSDVPKQFLPVAGQPILMHTISRFVSWDPDMEIIVVLPEPYFDLWNSHCRRYHFSTPHRLAAGGDTRFHSVQGGLRLIQEPCLVAVHDGVRPLVSHDTLSRVFDGAAEHGNAVPVTTIGQSMRRLDPDGTSHPVKREEYRLIQTPQCFLSDILKKAYSQEYRPLFTDDASVMEAMGERIQLVEGNPENLKITRPADLKYAEALLR